jgi:hypothetical protein
MANSSDGGISFDEPVPILKTWGPINSTYANGVFAIVYRVGDEEAQQLAVATTSDFGRSWISTIASGEMTLDFEVDKGPGISLSSSGTIDVVYYAHTQDSIDCVLNLESWQQTLPFGRIDPCEYNVYYSFSKDVGQSFSEPIKLNRQPILGEDLIQFMGGSQIGSHIQITSDATYAYPVWIGTPESGKTQVFSAKIPR